MGRLGHTICRRCFLHRLLHIRWPLSWERTHPRWFFFVFLGNRRIATAAITSRLSIKVGIVFYAKWVWEKPTGAAITMLRERPSASGRSWNHPEMPLYVTKWQIAYLDISAIENEVPPTKECFKTLSSQTFKRDISY
jgi:hypothetical protein